MAWNVGLTTVNLVQPTLAQRLVMVLYELATDRITTPVNEWRCITSNLTDRLIYLIISCEKVVTKWRTERLETTPRKRDDCPIAIQEALSEQPDNTRSEDNVHH